MLNAAGTKKTQNNGNKFIFTGKHVRLALTDSCDSILSSAPSDTESAHQNHPSEVPAHVDDTGTVFADWENGSTLGAVFGEDRIRRVN